MSHALWPRLSQSIRRVPLDAPLRPCARATYWKPQSDGYKPPGSRYELDANPRKPKDKPLRIKRGHRKSAANEAESNKAGASFKEPGSPASESHSHPPESQPKSGAKAAANGVKDGEVPYGE